jgi:hypothetical protein
MGRRAKYPWDEILSHEGAQWVYPFEDRQAVRASLNQWSKSRGKKVKTKRIVHNNLDTGDRSFMLEVTLLGS